MNDGGELHPEWLTVDSPAPKCVAELIMLDKYLNNFDSGVVVARCYVTSRMHVA